MLRLADSRTAAAVTWPSRREPVRIAVAWRAGPPTLREVRAALVADLIRRILRGRHGFDVNVLFATPSGHDEASLRDLSSLWIERPNHSDEVSEPPHLTVDTGLSVSAGTACLSVGPVTPVSVTLAALARGRHDRLAIRLALLSAAPERPASLGPTRLRSAARTLRRWRRRVAGWAVHEPATGPVDILEAAYAAADDNLNIGGMLSVLTRLERDLTVLPGAKLESFLLLDRILALDLARGLVGADRGGRRVGG